jgi:DNA-binding PadR family transcriptional regulator
MSLPHVLLGMLAEPASGYDLNQYFKKTVRNFWSAELSQIYPALARMEKDGLLKSNKVPSKKGPSRKVYSRTDAGDKSLRDWLSDGPILRSERLGYLTQVFLLDEIPMKKRITFMQALKADFEKHLAELEAVDAGWRESDPRYPDALPDNVLYKQMTLRLGIMKYRTTIEWCEECLGRMVNRK